ncbi:hypothetical protein [Candidatus Albibeggiatoa sp. nov. BB20]|uniref:hypothetical protein n=1 Tax=Candidatus Albibeggiatoa sp. nov. BB20 TaxID=3162723 RepID=UPI0033656490
MSAQKAHITPDAISNANPNNIVTVDSTTGEIIDKPEAIQITPPSNPIAILDTPHKQFAASLKRRDTNRQTFIDWVNTNLVNGTDYGSISVKTKAGRQVQTKPFLFKSGAEKIMAVLGLIAIFPNLQKYEEAAIENREISQIVLRCQLITSAGHIIGEGVGCRNVSKDFGDLNKSFKMAEKSATVDSVLRIMGLSEIYTQDKESVEEEMRNDTAAHPRQAQPQKPEIQSIGLHSDTHKKIEAMILTESKVKGINHQSFRDFVKSTLVSTSNVQFEHFPDVTKEWADWLINNIPNFAEQHANGA